MVSLVIAGLILVFVFAAAGREAVRGTRRQRRQRDRVAFIEAYAFPSGLREKVSAELPGLTEAQLDRVFEGLRQWFLVCLDTRTRREGMAGMPSRAVDVAWHEFILFTREYAAFCDAAFGGFLHHAPESVMSVPMHDALARTLSTARGLAPAAVVPLIFSIDAELGLVDGHLYDEQAVGDLEQHLRTSRDAAVVGGGGGCSGGMGCAAVGGGDGGGGSGGCGGGCGGGGCGGGGCGGG